MYMYSLLVSYLEEVSKIPFTAPNVESATNIGITHDMLPRVLFEKVWKNKILLTLILYRSQVLASLVTT